MGPLALAVGAIPSAAANNRKLIARRIRVMMGTSRFHSSARGGASLRFQFQNIRIGHLSRSPVRRRVCAAWDLVKRLLHLLFPTGNVFHLVAIMAEHPN